MPFAFGRPTPAWGRRVHGVRRPPQPYWNRRLPLSPALRDRRDLAAAFTGVVVSRILAVPRRTAVPAAYTATIRPSSPSPARADSAVWFGAVTGRHQQARPTEVNILLGRKERRQQPPTEKLAGCCSVRHVRWLQMWISIRSGAAQRICPGQHSCRDVPRWSPEEAQSAVGAAPMQAEEPAPLKQP